jgi:hypothetical protein
MMSELLSASRSTALKYACGSRTNSLPTLAANTVDAIKLASLVLILDGKALDDDKVIAVANRFENIAFQGDDGPWLFMCPPEYLPGLADINPDRMFEVAETWAATEEARLDRWAVADTTEFLKSLSTFCGETAAQGRDLFLFVVL